MNKEKIAIERLKIASKMSLTYYKMPLVVTTSGGKDSTVCVALAERARIPFEVLHSHTTADAPETVYFVRREFARLEDNGVSCSIDYPMYRGNRVSMWSLIPQKMIPPTRLIRYCCSVLKERSGYNRFVVTGVRWAESTKRQTRGIYEKLASDTNHKIILNNDNSDKRLLFESCRLKAKRVCNPIIDWTDADVWDYIQSEHLATNPLYGCGFSRVGCVGCPMAGKKRYAEFARYPRYRDAYIRAFDRMLEVRRSNGKDISGAWGTTGKDVYRWWMESGDLPGQIDFEDMEDET